MTKAWGKLWCRALRVEFLRTNAEDYEDFLYLWWSEIRSFTE